MFKIALRAQTYNPQQTRNVELVRSKLNSFYYFSRVTNVTNVKCIW